MKPSTTYILISFKADPDERLNIIHTMGDFVYNNYLSLPLFLVVPQAATQKLFWTTASAFGRESP